MTEWTRILSDRARRPETRWTAAGVFLFFIALTWCEVLDTGLSIQKARDGLAPKERRLAVLRLERTESRAGPDRGDTYPTVLHEEPLPRLLSGLASNAGGAAGTILEMNASSATAGSIPVTTRLRLTGHPGRIAQLLGELEQGPAHLLVTSITVQLPQPAFGSTTWIVNGVLP